MLEGLKDTLEHVEELVRENEKTEVVEICGHTYANKALRRYDTAKLCGTGKGRDPFGTGRLHRKLQG